jgi:hypothetical protein
MFGIVDGYESTTNPLILQIFRNEFKINDNQLILYGIVISTISFISVILSGILGDIYGRLKIIQICILLMILM